MNGPNREITMDTRVGNVRGIYDWLMIAKWQTDIVVVGCLLASFMKRPKRTQPTNTINAKTTTTTKG